MDENGKYKRFLSKLFDFELFKMFRYIGQVNRPVTKREYPRNYFRVNITILRLGFIWMPDWKRNIFVFLYSLLWIILAVILTPISEFMMFPSTAVDMNVFLNNLGIVLTHAAGAIKIINWCVQHKKILALMEVLQSDEFHYQSYGDFEPGFIAQRAKQKNVLFSTMYFWSCYLVLIIGYVEPTYSLIFQPENLKTLNFSGEKKFCWKLPFFSWMPFDHTTYWTCVLAYVIQFFLLMYLTFMIIAVDTLFMGLINYITAHLDIIQSAFKTIRARALVTLGRGSEQERILYDDEELNEEVKQQMTKATKYLQTIYSLCDAMEQIYSLQTLVQVLTTLVVMCTCMYLLSTEKVGSKLFVVEVFYIVAVQYQLFLYCWFGNELTLAHSRIPYAVYECDWFSTNGSFKKSMLITMIRTQRALVLTVGKFTPLTLNTLVTIIRGSYSLLAVLKKTNTDGE